MIPVELVKQAADPAVEALAHIADEVELALTEAETFNGPNSVIDALVEHLQNIENIIVAAWGKKKP